MVQVLQCRPHSGMITGLETKSGKELEPALRLMVVMAYDLFGPTSAPSACSQTTGLETYTEFRQHKMGKSLQSRLRASAL